jgi:ketosteroid isomerase-like protein
VVPDPVETEEVARAYCEAWNAPRDVDAMVAMMTDDVVIYDVLTGERYEGPDQAAAYIESTSVEIDTSDCGPALVGGDWVAGTYTLSSSGTSAGAEGISAVRILDGKVHWHLAFYTPTEDAQPPDDTSLRTDSTAGLRYCEAFADPARDPDAILATMTEEPKIYGIPNGFSAEGEDAVRRMIETRVVPSDVNTCGGKGSEGPGGTLANTSVPMLTAVKSVRHPMILLLLVRYLSVSDPPLWPTRGKVLLLARISALAQTFAGSSNLRCHQGHSSVRSDKTIRARLARTNSRPGRTTTHHPTDLPRESMRLPCSRRDHEIIRARLVCRSQRSRG